MEGELEFSGTLVRVASQLASVAVLALLLLAFGAGCIRKRHRWILEAPVQDFVNHTLLRGVGIGIVSLPPIRFDHELVKFVPEFIRDAKKHGVDIPLRTQDMLRQIVYVDRLSVKSSFGAMAACHRYYTWQQTLGGKRKLYWMTIEVLEKESRGYAGTDPASRSVLLRELMYHELFHCFLNKGHLPEGKSGIMSSTFIRGSRRAFQQWDALVAEMFSKEYMDLIPDAS